MSLITLMKNVGLIEGGLFSILFILLILAIFSPLVGNEESWITQERSFDHVKRHILLTGVPGCGKTTIVKRVLERCTFSAVGFYAEEECQDGERVAFIIHTLDGRSGYLAHRNLASEYQVAGYGVCIDSIENIAVPAIQAVSNEVIFIDEIGLMQCFSKRFVEATRAALDAAPIVIGTISLQNIDPISEFKGRKDVEIIEVTWRIETVFPNLFLTAWKKF